MYRPHPHVPEDTTQIQRSTDNGISQGEEFVDAVREIPESEVQVWEPHILVQKLLCKYGRAE